MEEGKHECRFCLEVHGPIHEHTTKFLREWVPRLSYHQICTMHKDLEVDGILLHEMGRAGGPVMRGLVRKGLVVHVDNVGIKVYEHTEFGAEVHALLRRDDKLYDRLRQAALNMENSDD